MSLDEVFSFIHISDTHIPESKEESVNGVQPYLKLEDTLNIINTLEIKPKFVIITGDLTRDGSLKGYKLLKQYTKKLKEKNIPTLLTLGNHDNRENFRTIFGLKNDQGPYFYVKEFGHIRLIVLDSLYPGHHTGKFTGTQLKWLETELHLNPDQPTIIALHHPIYIPWLKDFEVLFDSDQRQRFYKIINEYNVIAVINGHLHHNLVVNKGNVLFSQASSTYAELDHNDKEYWLKNTLNFNQVIIDNGRIFVRVLELPYDGRILGKGSIKILLE
jgi:3',5'-cyclic AMP phosphodiesterase CpdA